MYNYYRKIVVDSRHAIDFSTIFIRIDANFAVNSNTTVFFTSAFERRL